MRVTVRPLAVDDIDQVRDIEVEAFSAAWPQTAFKREIDNPRTAYLVAHDPPSDLGASDEGTGGEGASREGTLGAGPGNDEASGLVDNLKRLLGRPSRPQRASDQRSGDQRSPDQIVGFVGMWFMGPEAHITAIAVREARRGEGIGELLIVGSVREAMRRQAQVVTLEARVSNYVAHSLYEKYGFTKVGIRKGYYSDNREDAVIMTTERVDTADYQEKFDQLQQGYTQRKGDIHITLA